MRMLLAVVPLLALLLLACDDDAGGPRTLTIVVHDSFDASEELIAAFEEEHNATVEIIAGGDANEIVNRAILNAGNPEGDLLFGVDNLSYRRALEAGVFEEYEAERREDIPADVLAVFDGEAWVTPIDFGFVTLNMDPAAGAPPQSLEELTEPAWDGALVVEDPATSSPGLQFLAQTVVNFGEGGWQDFWRALRENDVLVAGGWTDAYYTQFSFYDGQRPLVVSYTSSPAAEAFFGELAEPPTVNVNLGQLVRQVEAAGVLEGADEPELAREFVDFMLSDEFQSQIPETMFVYPVMPGVATPEWWRWAEVNFQFSDLSPEPEEVERWVAEWTAIMRR